MSAGAGAGLAVPFGCASCEYPRIADQRLGHLPRRLSITLGFPKLYGRNLNTWIDCLTYPDQQDGMTTVAVEPGDVLTLQLDEGSAFAGRCPDQYAAVIEAAAFVNWRRIKSGLRPIIALSFR